ncbi:hypothetical protein AAMO2058_000193800 [Amorphochlora amoebiformis]
MIPISFSAYMDAKASTEGTLWKQSQETQEIECDNQSIFGNRLFSEKKHGPMKWMSDGLAYTTVETTKERGLQGFDIVRHSAKSRVSRVLVSASQLIPSGKTTPLPIHDYEFSSNQRLVLVFTNARKVWRSCSRGDYYILDLQTGKLQKIGNPSWQASQIYYAKIDPTNTYVGFVFENNIYSQHVANATLNKLTMDGLPGNGGMAQVINGNFDWVYEEEFSLKSGWRWSPDGKKIAYWQLNTSKTGYFSIVNNTDGIYSRITKIPYPKVGTSNAIARIGVVSVEGGSSRWMGVNEAVDLDRYVSSWGEDEEKENSEGKGDSDPGYIARMDWAENSEELVVLHLPRKQNTIRVILANSKTGECKVILAEQDECWLDVNDSLRWLDDGKRFTWLSERSGYRHLYVVSRDGKDIVDATADMGTTEVVEVLSVNSKKGIAYITAAREAQNQQLYSVDLQKLSSSLLTPSSLQGFHSYNISPESGAYAIHSWSRFETPTQIDIVSLPDHMSKRVLIENEKLKKRLEKVPKGPFSFFKVPSADGNTQLDGWMIKPPSFDEKRTYPMIVFVYGEPAACTVVDRFSRFYPWHLMMAKKGYIIASIDSRGSPAPRGRKFRKCVYKKIGIQSPDDQAAAVKALKKAHPYIGTVGMWGWSGGGSSTLHALFRHGDVFKVGVAIAFVAHQKYYDTICKHPAPSIYIYIYIYTYI